MNRIAYLAGAMESVEDEGLKWRREYSKELEKLNISCIIPNDEERFLKKVNMKELKKTDIHIYISIMRQIIEQDLNLIKKSDMIICYWEGEISSGTMGELTYAYMLRKTCYLITPLSLQDIPGWFLSCFTRVFYSLDKLIDYLS